MTQQLTKYNLDDLISQHELLKEKNPVEIVCLLDRSSSMSSILNDAINGFNKFLLAQQKMSGDANLTLALFDNKYKVICDGLDIKKVVPLTRETFVPRGSTALLDAIGYSIRKLDARLGENHKSQVLICVLTDGAENCSTKFTHDSLRNIIQAKQSIGWEFVFLAASIAGFNDASSIGIRKNNCSTFSTNSVGVSESFSKITSSVTNFRQLKAG